VIQGQNRSYCINNKNPLQYCCQDWQITIHDIRIILARSLCIQGLSTRLFVKVPRPGDSEVAFSRLRVKLPPVTTSLTTQRQRQSVKCLAQGHNKWICRPISIL